VKIEIAGIDGLPEIERGADLGALIATRAAAIGQPLRTSDLVVVTQKIVSKAEGRRVRLSSIEPSAFAEQWAAAHGLDPRIVELVMSESRRVVRMDRGVLIVETHGGFVCANAGVDLSNVTGGEEATLLPVDPDASARGIRASIAAQNGADVAVIISDTFGRPWREGLVNVAIGVAGMRPLKSYVGRTDPLGFPLQATIQALADEIAAAAGLVSSKLNRIPAVVVRGVDFDTDNGSARELLRAPDRDLFR
jgi:coenzyme F420-0:L-glutamate ligase/coenzyme F420-1:gamma-L-glutamate ligase